MPITSQPRLLVVDDDPEIRDLLSRYLSSQGFVIDTVEDGSAMRHRLNESGIDLVLLDLGLPGEDGLTVIRHLREHWRGPVIIVSGRGEPVERVVGLELGADDYITKPFDLRELLARIRSVLRRSQANLLMETNAHRGVAFEGFCLDLRARRLNDGDGNEVELTPGEFTLLVALVGNAGEVLSRDRLMSELHGRATGPFDRAIDVQIGRLRRKIESDPAKPTLIKSVRGVGYIFTGRVAPT